jgi:general secretion pathway protein D
MLRTCFIFVWVVLAAVSGGICFGQTQDPSAANPSSANSSASNSASANQPAANQPAPNPITAIIPCGEGTPAVVGCAPSKKESKEAKTAFAAGLRLEHAKHMQEAFEAFDRAAHLVPQNVSYVTAREMAREQLVFDEVQQGNVALSQGRQTEALADFRGALELDPKNDFAQQQLRQVSGEWAPAAPSAARIVQATGELKVEPDPLKGSFHYRGNGTDLINQISHAFGVSVTFDESVVPRQVQFDIDDVDFYGAMRAASDVTHTFWTPLQEKQIFIATESADNHRKFDRMALRSFYVPGVTTPTDLASIVTLLRTVFDLKLINQNTETSTITIRAPQDVLDAATQVLEGLDSSRPEIMLEMHAYQMDHTYMRNLGLQIPNQFQLFNIPAAALLALGGQNIQQLINQLISGGGINQANSQTISALLAQLQNQQNSIFSQPLATFGGGKTFEGLSLGTVGAQVSLNESWVHNLQNLTTRISQGEEATMRVGTRIPIINATFAPIFNSSAISQVLQNNSFQAPFPSFTYEDLGVSLKAKPAVNGESAISLHLEMQLRTLVGQSLNGVPIIANREFNGSMMLVDGQPAVIAGAVTHSEEDSMTGIPGFGYVPGLNQVMTTNSKQEEDDELLIVITPRVIRQSAHSTASEVWLPH